MAQAIAQKQRRYADVMADGASSLLVLGSEVYGRWSPDAVQVVRELVALKAGQAPPTLRGCAAYAWSNRWWALISVGTQRAVAEALLRDGGADLQPNPPVESVPDLVDVLTDF